MVRSGAPRRITLARAAFIAWRLAQVEKKLALVAAERDEMRAKSNRREESIWLMKKDRLVEKAHDELQMPLSEAQTRTAGELRQRLLNHRVEQREAHADRVPKGLACMTHAELVDYCQTVGIPTEDPRKPGRPQVREQMIMDIKEHGRADNDTEMFADSATSLLTGSDGGPSGSASSSPAAARPPDEWVQCFARGLDEVMTAPSLEQRDQSLATLLQSAFVSARRS